MFFFSTVCEDGKYGPNCLKTCSRQCGGEYTVCDKIEGICPFGCLDGYTGAKCNNGKKKKGQALLYVKRLTAETLLGPILHTLYVEGLAAETLLGPILHTLYVEGLTAETLLGPILHTLYVEGLAAETLLGPILHTLYVEGLAAKPC